MQINKMLQMMVKAGGADFFKTFFKKFPFTRSRFGSKAKTKDGIPMVTALAKVSCTGIKGYGISMNKKRNAKMQE